MIIVILELVSLNNNNNNNNGLISVHPWYGSSPDIRVEYGNQKKKNTNTNLK